MKQGTLITRIVMILLFAAVALYLCIYAVRSLSNPFTTVPAYQDTLDDSAECTGYLVREEQVLPGGAAIMDLLPDEGERVGAGQVVAVLYQNGDALDRKNQLQAMEQEKERLEYALNSGSDLGDAAKLESQIIHSLIQLRASTASGDLSSLENDALSLRTQVLQREFAYSGTTDSAAALQETISQLDAQILDLRAQSSYDTTSVRAPFSGLFSGQVDGYETTLTPALLDTVTVAQLGSIGTSPVEGTPVGKLITDSRWYFATAVDEAVSKRLQEGDTIRVAFSRDYTGDIIMRVERIGLPEGGSRVLILSSSRYLKETTLLRRQTVDLIFQRYEGIRVPKKALRLITKTEEDPDTKQETSYQVTGVFTLVGAQAEFKPVDIVREGSDYYLVKPSDSAGEKILRAGDELILDAEDLYDGKVVLT